MMLEIIDGAIQVDPQIINGISQTLANGFDKYWKDWNDINAMVEIVKQHLGKNIDHHYLLLHMKFGQCEFSAVFQGTVLD